MRRILMVALAVATIGALASIVYANNVSERGTQVVEIWPGDGGALPALMTGVGNGPSFNTACLIDDAGTCDASHQAWDAQFRYPAAVNEYGIQSVTPVAPDGGALTQPISGSVTATVSNPQTTLQSPDGGPLYKQTVEGSGFNASMLVQGVSGNGSALVSNNPIPVAGQDYTTNCAGAGCTRMPKIDSTGTQYASVVVSSQPRCDFSEPVTSACANTSGDGGVGVGWFALPPLAAGCEYVRDCTGDLCTLFQTVPTPVPPTCSLTTGTTGTFCWGGSSSMLGVPLAMTTTADAGASDASVYSLIAVTGTPCITVRTRCCTY
jgi:hypothetical protein